MSRLVLGLTVALASSTAIAQTETVVKPYVLLLFDTSGSMDGTICGGGSTDNSSECPGNDVSCSTCNFLGCGNSVGDDSRIYKVKKGATSVVSMFGEVTFGLARFRQVARKFNCPAGGWRGASGNNHCGPDSCCDDADMGEGRNQADVLVDFSDTNNTSEILSWMNNCDDYKGCPKNLAPSSGCSLCADCGTGCDKELRPHGYTPIAGSLYDLRTNFFNGPGGVIAGDPKAACRPYKVILLTDGQDNCQGDPVDEAAALFSNPGKSIPVHVIGFAASSLKGYLDEIAVAGGTGEAVVADDEVSLALAMASIISESLLSEKCNNADDDCDGECDESFPEVAVTNPACSNNGRPAKTCTAGIGICQRFGNYVCEASGLGSTCTVAAGPPNPGGEVCGNSLDDDCDGQIDEGCAPCISQPEICDGKDNDCDGKVDEGYVSVPCGSDIGACAKGTTACVSGQVVCNGATPPTTELCDNIDNNCDTLVDFFVDVCYPPSAGCDLSTGVCQGVCRLGSSLCSNGSWGTCLDFVGPGTETCNGLDDDCDGETDEGVSNSCTNFADCSTYTSCQACPITPAEVCDGADNDCNGAVDDDPVDVGGLCGSGAGECERGIRVCESGQLVCQGEIAPQPEVCDGKDNDCNSAIDDNVPGEGEPCGTDVGACEPGQTRCVAGEIVCIGGTQPAEEICDGKDNDCDGEADEFAECPGESSCVEGQCVLPCASKLEFACPGGMSCVNGYCLPDACAKVTCASHERCQAGVCVDRCSDRSCDDHEKCNPNSGQCVDDSCLTKGCPSGRVCINYRCVETDCLPDTCPSSQQCYEGRCYDSCLDKRCPDGQACVQGSCVHDPCASKNCPEDKICEADGDRARCVDDPCWVIACAPGQACIDAECIDDPCAITICPLGQRCVLSSANQPTCERASDQAQGTTTKVLATGGGGLSCSLGSGPPVAPPWSTLLLLLSLGLCWRRRRRIRIRRHSRVRAAAGAVFSAEALALVLLAALLALLSACAIDPFDIHSGRGGDASLLDEHARFPGDSGPGFGDSSNNAAEGAGCLQTAETCDGKDNDCNGLVDDVDPSHLANDVNHCGSCGNPCSFPNAFGECNEGSCRIKECAPGYYDINGKGVDGCEYQCVPSNGGDEACPIEDRYCACDGADNDCDGEVDEGFDTSSDPNNCGDCGNRCLFDNALGLCQAGSCVMGPCEDGFIDLNGDADDGCEYGCPVWPAALDDPCDGIDNDCDGQTDEDLAVGSCGTDVGECELGTVVCVGGVEACEGSVAPTAELCNNKDDDCDGVVDNGFDKQNDPRYCGAGCVHCAYPHALPQCVAGACSIAVCDSGWIDLNGVAGDGCEYHCTVTGPEICDGKDNDCDGLTDTTDPDMVKLAYNPCLSVGACAGATASCQGALGWVCSYGSEVQLQTCGSNADCITGPCAGGVCPGVVALEESLCDDQDNDCDGQVDEPFSSKDLPCAESGETGICQGTGAFVCKPDKSDTVCVITTQGQPATDEECNGKDDDCDGEIDEEQDDAAGLGVVDDMIHITHSGLDFYIYVYEASRPDASASSAGSDPSRACSKGSVKPWADLTFAQAAEACSAAGKRLCTAEEWLAACAGSQARVFPYGDSYQPTTCNGQDSGTGGVLPTGSKTGCESLDGVLDLCGNVREWTDDEVTDGSVVAYTVRGGGFDTPEPGLTCATTFVVMPPTFTYPNLGFRCCANSPP